MSKIPLTIEEWANQNEHTKLLRTNLLTNLEVMTDLNDEDIQSVLRLHLIMVRQFARETGAKVET